MSPGGGAQSETKVIRETTSQTRVLCVYALGAFEVGPPAATEEESVGNIRGRGRDKAKGEEFPQKEKRRGERCVHMDMEFCIGETRDNLI